MKASIYIRPTLSDGSRPFLRPVRTGNHRIKPGWALLDGQPTETNGDYYLRYQRDGKRVWELIGPDLPAALTAATDRNKGNAAPVKVKGQDLQAAAETYLEEVKAAKAKRTSLAYRLTVDAFIATCKAATVQKIGREEVLTYTRTLRAAGLSDRTISNRLIYLKTFLLHFGVAWPLKPTDRVKYTEKTVEAYSAEELQRLFTAADQEQTDLFQFFLCTGFREQEVQFATWGDVDFARKLVKVTEKQDLGFTPKDREEASIPVPDSLVALLKERRKRYPGTRLIFGTSGNEANGHFLRTLQRLALRAGLNCGECYSRKGPCCIDHPICHRWGLHRFRKTFATMHHEAGVSVRTIQRWLRHSSLDTTLRYLAGSDDTSVRTRTQVNNTFASVHIPSPAPEVTGMEVAA